MLALSHALDNRNMFGIGYAKPDRFLLQIEKKIYFPGEIIRVSVVHSKIASNYLRELRIFFERFILLIFLMNSIFCRDHSMFIVINQ